MADIKFPPKCEPISRNFDEAFLEDHLTVKKIENIIFLLNPISFFVFHRAFSTILQAFHMILTTLWSITNFGQN